jgi:predicted TIM-barrel fold metal-dependent hydrolase
MHAFARSLVLSTLMLAGATQAQTPAGDYHQHVFSKEDIALAGLDSALQPLDAKDVVALLDAAGIRKAVLLSIAFWYGKPGRQVDDEPGQVRRENDWTVAQAARYPDRLVAFCSFNPLKDYAIKELERCAAKDGLVRGIKLHFGNSDVQLDDPAHLARLREVFAAANRRRMAIVVHMRPSISKGRPYGARQARIFLEQLLPAAPDVTVQVAQLVADTIRQVGTGRVLYGTDSAQGGNLRPRESWEAFRKLPLTRDEFADIANKVPPYMAAPGR